MSMWESRQPIHQQAECSSVFSTRQWQILIWFYFSILVILHVLLNPSWSSNCIQLRQNRAKSISNPVKADSILVPPLLPSLSIKKRKSGTTRLASKKDVPCGKPNGTKAFHPTGNVFGVVFGFFFNHQQTCHASIWIPSSYVKSTCSLSISSPFWPKLSVELLCCCPSHHSNLIQCF